MTTAITPRDVATPVDKPSERPHSGTRNLNPPGIGLLALIREDFRTHQGDLLSPGFIAIAVHRYGNWRMSIRARVLRIPFSLLYRVLNRFVLLVFKIELPYTTPLGRRVRIWHHGGMVLGAARIGDDVVIRHHVTIGLAHHFDSLDRLPVIEDQVQIGCGAVILGAVRLGTGCVVGANAVVTHDVAPWTLVVGAPARQVRVLREPVLHEPAAGAAPASSTTPLAPGSRDAR